MVVEVLIMIMGEVLDKRKVGLKKRIKKKKRLNSTIMMVVVTEGILGVISSMRRGLAS